jgi:hypothetical protein
MKFYYSFFLSAMLVLASCEYEPSGEYTPDIKKPDVSAPLIVDLNAAGDTILVDLYSVLEFKFQTEDRELYWMKYCIGHQCETSNSDAGIYRIFMGAHNVMPGTIDLTVDVFTETGTGSIADILGAEGFLYSKKFTLIVVEKLDGLKMLSVKPENGSLKLSWEKYEFSDFLEYTIVKSNGFSSETVAVINNQHITSIYDDSYVGGQSEYRVDLKTNSRDLKGISTSYEDGFPEINVQKSDNYSVTLSWEKSRYINNIKGYEIYVLYNGYELVAEITDPDATSWVLGNLRFLYDNEVFLRFVPKILPSYYYLSSSFLGSKAHIGYIGDKFDAGTIVTPLGDFLYYQKENFIYEYNYITEEVTSTIELRTSNLTFSVSPNRKYILIDDGLTSESILLFTIDSKEVKRYSWSQLADYLDYVHFLSISDNGKAVFGVNNNPEVLVYDFLNEKKIFEGGIYPLSSSFKISSDGKYLFSRDQVFEIQADTVLLAQDFTNEIQYCSFFDFHMSDPDLFVYGRNDNLYVKRISDLSTVSECYIHWMLDIFNIDYNANQVLVHKEEKLRVYDLGTCEEVLNWPVSYWGLSPERIRLSNNTIYDSGLGLRLKINQGS